MKIAPSLLVLCALATVETVAAQGGFGSRVATGDGVVYVAEPNNIARSGIVYAYGSRGGKWTELAKLTAPDAAVGDGFGAAIAANGSMVLATRIRDEQGRGAVYVFDRRGDQWQSAGRIVPADAAPNDSAGVALALSGDVALIGSARANNGAGAAYVYRRTANGWTQEAKLVASNAKEGDRFGGAVAVDGNRIVIGAPGQEKARGGAYLFLRDASGAWKQEATLVARTVKEGDGLGRAVALLRDYAIAAAPGRDENTGAVYLFEKNPNAPADAPSTWAAFTRFFPYEGGSQSQFGASISIVGDELWIASPGADGFQGTIYRYAWDSVKSDWVAVRKLSYAEAGGQFSTAFAVGGTTAIAGLPGKDFGEGAAVVFSKAADGEWKPDVEVASEPEAFARVSGKAQPCAMGKSSAFDCNSVELLSFLPNKEIGGKRGIMLNDIWGWTDPQTGKEYALVGRMDGTSFVDVSNPSNPVYLGDLPLTEGAKPNVWRDIKVYKDHAYIVADGAGKHGMQVFDLTQLRNVKNAPVTFKPVTTYDRIHSAHNVVINEDKGMAFAVGSNGGGETCGGGLHIIDIRQPKNPRFMGCFSDTQTGQAKTGYSHDAQCVTYKGPDTKYRGREICFGANETALSVADITDKAKPVAVSRASYPNVAYSHQGWLTEDQRYLYMNDEGDEANGTVKRTRTLIWDVSDLDDPQLVGEYLGETGAIDHNLYIKGDLMYESNYVSGLRIIDISDRKNPREVGFFDTVPNSPNNAVFLGSWSNYPFFKSGIVVFTSMREGLFVVKMQRPIS